MPKWETEYVWKWNEGDDKIPGAKKYEENPDEKHKLTKQEVLLRVPNTFPIEHRTLHNKGQATLYVRNNWAILFAPGTSLDRELKIAPTVIKEALLSGCVFTPYTRFRRKKIRFVSPI